MKFGEWIGLFAICAADDSPAGVRDAVLIALFKIAGLRRAEMAALSLGDYDQANHNLTIYGKRNKRRVVPIEDAGLYLLLNEGGRATMTGPLFTRINKGGTITHGGLTDQGIYHILDNRRQQTRIATFTPHDLRRTFAGDLLDAGVDLSKVQKLMGHANANTTSGYDRRGERAKRDAVCKLHVPINGAFQAEDVEAAAIRDTGIIFTLENGSTLEKAQRLANQADIRTTMLYDRRNKTVKRGVVERIVI